MLRQSEPERVRRSWRFITRYLLFVDASDRFIDNAGGTEPEKKRKIIGNKFIGVFEEKANGEKDAFLAQGTLYPDVIESSRRGPRP